MLNKSRTKINDPSTEDDIIRMEEIPTKYFAKLVLANLTDVIET